MTSASSGAITLYGIRNCDTMKKARRWLDERGVVYRFHDYKVDGIDAGRLAGWVRRLGWDAVLNRAGTTFRNLDDGVKSGLDEDKAIALMLDQPSMIKRPMLERGDDLTVGFKPQVYESIFVSGS